MYIASIVVTGARAWLVWASALVLAACGETRARRPSVLLVTLDTTRADALGPYGRDPSVSPHFDALARESTTYLWARTVTPTTLPAHSSMLTGLYPNRHTVRDNTLTALPQSASTLAELAALADYETAAFVSARVLDSTFGLAQGFATYSQPARVKKRASDPTFASRRARDTAAEFARWLDVLPDERSFFAWVHFFDAHTPWEAGESWLSRAGGQPYLAEIAAQDDALGSLLAELRTRGRDGDTTVLVVGDHGEGLGDHGEATHSYFVFDSTLRVPFVVRRADRAGAGTRSEDTVSVVDVLPTLCDALALDAPAGIDGVSLWRGPLDAERGVYFESYYGFLHYGMAPIAGWVDARAKYVHSSRRELYDPRQQPSESTSLLAERSADVERYRGWIEQQERKSALEPDRERRLDDRVLRDVQALGYAGAVSLTAGFPSALAESARPSPHERAEELQACERARDLVFAGRFQAAARLLQEVLESHPDNCFALEHLGFAELNLGAPSAARARFERAIALGPDRSSLQRGLALALAAAGELAQAQVALERARVLDPSDVVVLELLLANAVERKDDAARARWQTELERTRTP